MATARLQYRKNGGSLHEDSIAVAGGDVISLTAASFAGWQRARWEIAAFPPDWPCPSGWSTDASSGLYYYLANSGPSGVTPPDVTIPDEGDFWGKWLFRLTANSTIVSAKIGVETVSPNLELHDKAFGESTQFGATRGHVGPEQENLRAVDDFAGSGAGGITSYAYVVDATTAAGLPAAVTGRALAATLGFTRIEGTPLSFTYATTQADAASKRRALDVKLSVTDNSGHGAAGNSVGIAFWLPDDTTLGGVNRDVATMRGEWVSPVAATPTAKAVIAVRGTDGLVDRLSLDSAGVLSLLGSTALIQSTGASVLSIAGGTSGSPVPVSLKTGTTERLRIESDGTAITATADALKVVGSGGVQADGGFDSATAVSLTIGGNMTTGVRLGKEAIPVTSQGPFSLLSRTVAQLTGGTPDPDPTTFAGAYVTVTNDSTGCQLARAVGGIWVRATTGVLVA